ncbi:rod shape-determining protein MreD [Halomonas denitrificans]|uniref:rod shape-determining protein MreD n=1 Tax=Halomonas TaxID=2745 RepID=UPI001A8F86DB|nr:MULTISPECIES: rod shape-determining protein MreD [Halomonas]MED5295698.1 rod shape-determining protein MreD [Pseudomonadota bacterium]MBN8413527.1 rod shape-determining protein MreD [Halomonas litopenaei]MBY5926125.1 rod shape-determining protein MreD [Halomonas sp. DP4Y7-2]MBY5931164.1 rod shape-determining protein MreD [Halomonas sp. DP8Y7-3]MBY5969064.1 rod shape-determining protein MreD [Halomonas denitrificans]
MAATPRASLLLVWLTLALSLCLQVMPMADGWQVWRPDWLGLMLLYWCMTQPDRVGVFHGFALGLLLDLIEGAPLGQSALTLSLLAFLGALVYPRFRTYSLVQQAVLIFVLLGLVQLVEQWLRTLFGPFSMHLSFLMPSLIGAALWPWLVTLFKALGRRAVRE